MGCLKRGVNDLQSCNPELSLEWDYEKNDPLTPNDVAAGSHKKAWWICSKCGHSWYTNIYARNNGNGCPACGQKKSTSSKNLTVLRNGTNTLRTYAPAFLGEWDYEKNQNITPDDVTPKSARKVWWKCKKCGSSYYAKICGRTIENKGCPVCAGIEVREGINDLATVNPEIAKEWDCDNNTDIFPTMVTSNSNKRVYWKCSTCGFVWKASIADRNRGTGCPQCKKIFYSSLPEQILFWYVSRTFEDAKNGYKVFEDGRSYEVDIFIPSLKIGIEYDGVKWHNDVQKDLEKNEVMIHKNIQLIRVREPGLIPIFEQCYSIMINKIDKNYIYMQEVIQELSVYLNEHFNTKWQVYPNLDKELPLIRKMLFSTIKSHSLKNVAPNLSLEWNIEANNGLTPDQVSAHSDFKATWTCQKCGGIWKASVNDRVKGHGCPFCAGVRVRTGYNDFATMRPELVQAWNYEKNGDTLPENIAYRSRKKIWWHCDKCGQDYLQRVADKSNGIGCPVCAGRIIITGVNDLATNNPELALEWDYEKNGDLLPDMVAPQSNKKAWWICSKCGHSWAASICSRNGNGRGCSLCSRKKQKA